MLKLVVLSPLNGVSQSSASQILMSYQPPGHLVKVILGWGLRCEFNKLPGEVHAIDHKPQVQCKTAF